MPSYAFCDLLLVGIIILHLHAPKLHLHTGWDPDQFTMALMFNSDCIIYYHMHEIFSTSRLFGGPMLGLQHSNLLIQLTKRGLKSIAMLSSFQRGLVTHLLALYGIASWL